MPISRNTKRLKYLQDLAKEAGKVKVQDLTCSQGHPVWQWQFVTDPADLCPDCTDLRSQYEHPFGADKPTFVLTPPKPTTRLPDLPAGYGGPDAAAAAAGGAAGGNAADTGWSTQYDGFGPMDEGVSMVRAADRPYQPKLWR